MKATFGYLAFEVRRIRIIEANLTFFTWIQQLTTKNVYYEAFDEIFIICLLFIKGLTKQQLIAMCELMIIKIVCWNFTHWLFPRNYVNLQMKASELITFHNEARRTFSILKFIFVFPSIFTLET